MNDALVLRNVVRTYRTEAGELPVLRGVDLTLRAGEIVALVAPSGAGKSTLLHLAGLLDQPDGGQVIIEGREAGKLSDTMDGGTTSLSAKSRKYSAITPLPSVADTRT